MNTPRIVEDRIGIGMIENRKGLESMGLRAWEWVWAHGKFEGVWAWKVRGKVEGMWAWKVQGKFEG